MTIKAIREAYKGYGLDFGGHNSFVIYNYNDGNGKVVIISGVKPLPLGMGRVNNRYYESHSWDAPPLQCGEETLWVFDEWTSDWCDVNVAIEHYQGLKKKYEL